MIINKLCKAILLISAVAYVGSALAVTPDEEKEKKCLKPKFRFFSPENGSEVAPGSTISFHVSRDASPFGISAEAKNIKLEVNVKNRVNFYDVTASLPAELSDTFARISLHAKAGEGDCTGHDGWLLKIKPAGEAIATPATAETASTPKPESAVKP